MTSQLLPFQTLLKEHGLFVVWNIKWPQDLLWQARRRCKFTFQTTREGENQTENAACLNIFEGFLEICNERKENFCSVRAEQLWKVRSEKEVEKEVREKKTNEQMKILKGRVCFSREYPFNSTKINAIQVSNDPARVIRNSVPTKVIRATACDEGLRRKTSALETL